MGKAPEAPRGRRRRAALSFIIATVAIDMLGVGLVWPILPQLIKSFPGQTIVSAAWVYGLLLSCFAVIQFFFSPLIGMLSDRFGRRPILLLSLGGLGIDYCIMALAPNLIFLVIARIIAGLCSSTVSTANAYIADITRPKDRAAAFGLLGAAFGFGFIIGPLIGGLLGQYSLQAPFWLAAGLAFANCAFGFFVVPESLRPERRRAVSLTRANPFSALLHMRRYSFLTPLLLALFATALAQQGLQAIWVLWGEAQFGWGVAQTGYSLAWVGLWLAFAQGFLVRVLVKRFRQERVLLAGLVLSIVSFLALPFLTQGWSVYPVILFHLIGWGSAAPILTALMSQNVPDSEQGLLQGTSNSLNTLAMIIAPIMAGAIFAETTAESGGWPGAFYFLAAFLFAVAAVLLAFLAPKKAESAANESPERITRN